MKMKLPAVGTPLLPIHLAGIVTVVVIASAFTLLIVRPRARAADDVAKLNFDLEEVQRQIERQTQSSEKSRQQADELKAQLDAEPLVLGPVSRLNARLADLSKRAEEMSIKVLELVPGVEQKTSAAIKVPIRLRGEGTYASITSLLARTHTDFPDLAVVKMSIRGEPNSAMTAASISVDFEWFAESVEPAGSGSKKNER